MANTKEQLVVIKEILEGLKEADANGIHDSIQYIRSFLRDLKPRESESSSSFSKWLEELGMDLSRLSYDFSKKDQILQKMIDSINSRIGSTRSDVAKVVKGKK